jgi:hypothetical protein
MGDKVTLPRKTEQAKGPASRAGSGPQRNCYGFGLLRPAGQAKTSIADAGFAARGFGRKGKRLTRDALDIRGEQPLEAGGNIRERGTD